MIKQYMQQQLNAHPKRWTFYCIVLGLSGLVFMVRGVWHAYSDLNHVQRASKPVNASISDKALKRLQLQVRILRLIKQHVTRPSGQSLLMFVKNGLDKASITNYQLHATDDNTVSITWLNHADNGWAWLARLLQHDPSLWIKAFHRDQRQTRIIIGEHYD